MHLSADTKINWSESSEISSRPNKAYPMRTKAIVLIYFEQV